MKEQLAELFSLPGKTIDEKCLIAVKAKAIQDWLDHPSCVIPDDVLADLTAEARRAVIAGAMTSLISFISKVMERENDKRIESK